MDNNKMFILILLTVVFGVCLLFSVGVQKADQGHFDEMQEMIRGKGYKIALFTNMIFLATYFTYDYILGDIWVKLSASLLALFSIVIGVTTYISYCIWNNAYIQVNKKGTGAMIMYAAIAILNLLSFSLGIDRFHLTINNGILQFNGMFLQLAISVIYGITPIVYFARKVIDRVES